MSAKQMHFAAAFFSVLLGTAVAAALNARIANAGCGASFGRDAVAKCGATCCAGDRVALLNPAMEVIYATRAPIVRSDLSGRSNGDDAQQQSARQNTTVSPQEKEGKE